MSAGRRKQLLAEYRSLKEREVDILTEFFETKLDTSYSKSVSRSTLIVGDKVKILSGGVNSRLGDEGIVFKITDKRSKVKLSRNQALVKRAFNKIERI